MFQQNSLFEFKGNKDEVYVCQQLLGSGSEGQVYQGIKKDQPQIKLAIKFSNETRNDELQFLSLIQKQQKSDNPLKNIISYYDVIENPRFLNNYENRLKNYCFVMELGGQNLLESVIQNNNYSEKQKIEIIYQVCLGIQELHSLKHIHRDLKPENIIKIGDSWKLCDFGFLKHQISQLKTQRVGTPYYIAPEVFNQNNYDYKVDIWSFGCIIYEIITNEIFFFGTTTQEVEQTIQNYAANSALQNYDSRFKKISNIKLQQLCKGMITVNPQERYDINQVKKELAEILQINFNSNPKQFIQPPNVKPIQGAFGQIIQTLPNTQQFTQTQIFDNKFPNPYFPNNNPIPTNINQNPIFKNSVQNQQNNQNSKQNTCFPNNTFQSPPKFTNINNFQNNQQFEQQKIDNCDTNYDPKQNEDQQKIKLQIIVQELLSKSLDKVIKPEKKNEILQCFDQSINDITCDLQNLGEKNDIFQNKLTGKIADKLVYYIKLRVNTTLQKEKLIE